MKSKVIDVTFRGGRQQSEIVKELSEEMIPDELKDSNVGEEYFEEIVAEVPDVVTNETLKEYCLEVLKITPKSNQKKRRVYAGLIDLVNKNEELKEENRKLRMEELQSQDKSVIEELGNEEDN